MADVLSDNKIYVVGFGFTLDRSQVVLLDMQRPLKFKGMRNGSGGEFEPDKDIDERDAMCRENKQETGVETERGDWYFLGVFGKAKNIHAFCAFSDNFKKARTMTDEEVFLVNVADIDIMPAEKLVPDVPEMIERALAIKPPPAP